MIEVAKTAGFCFGVKRAVELAEKLSQTEKQIYCVQTGAYAVKAMQKRCVINW